jgi:hypothetical protein
MRLLNVSRAFFLHEGRHLPPERSATRGRIAFTAAVLNVRPAG